MTYITVCDVTGHNRCGTVCYPSGNIKSQWRTRWHTQEDNTCFSTKYL